MTSGTPSPQTTTPSDRLVVMNESADSEPGETDPAPGQVTPAQPVAADPLAWEPADSASKSTDAASQATSAKSDSKPAGTVYRSSRRPGLTSPGVAVIGSTVSVLAAILSMLITDGLGWVFGVPFVLVSAYCAWEVRRDSTRAALIMPPLVLLLVVVVVPAIFGDVSSLRDAVTETLKELTKLAPMMFAAVGVSGAILAWRRWGQAKK